MHRFKKGDKVQVTTAYAHAGADIACDAVGIVNQVDEDEVWADFYCSTCNYEHEFSFESPQDELRPVADSLFRRPG